MISDQVIQTDENAHYITLNDPKNSSSMRYFSWKRDDCEWNNDRGRYADHRSGISFQNLIDDSFKFEIQPKKSDPFQQKQRVYQLNGNEKIQSTKSADAMKKKVKRMKRDLIQILRIKWCSWGYDEP